jgi:hypothetical protein
MRALLWIGLALIAASIAAFAVLWRLGGPDGTALLLAYPMVSFWVGIVLVLASWVFRKTPKTE